MKNWDQKNCRIFGNSYGKSRGRYVLTVCVEFKILEICGLNIMR